MYGPPDLPGRAPDVVGEEDRAPRPPWLRRAVALAVLVAVVVLAGPRLLPGLEPGRLLSSGSTPTPSADPTPGPSPTSSPTGSAPAVLTWPTRGDLAADGGFLALVRGRPGVPPDAAVLWAGEVPGGRLALLAAGGPQPDRDVDEGLRVLAVRVSREGSPADVPAEEIGRLTASSELGAGSELDAGSGESGFVAPALAGWVGDAVDGAHAVVVVGPPGPLELDVSERAQYRPDGTVSRAWSRVTSADGIWRGSVPGPLIGPAVLRRAGVSPEVEEPLVVGPAWWGGDHAEPPEPEPVLPVSGLDEPGYAGPPAGTMRERARELGPLATASGVQAQVLWSGRLDGVPVAVVRIRLPEGPTFHWTVVGDGNGGTFTGEGTRPVPWLDDEGWPSLVNIPDFARRGRGGADGADDDGERLWLVRPRGGGSVEVRGKGAAPRTLRLGPEGAVRLPSRLSGLDPRVDSTLHVRDKGGRTVLEERLSRLRFPDVWGFDALFPGPAPR